MNAPIAAALLFASMTHRPAPETCPGPVDPRLYVSVSISGDYVFGTTYALTSPASVAYSDCWGERAAYTISGQHAIVTPNGFDHVKASEPFSTGGGAWSGWLNADGVRTWCYYGQVSAWTYDFRGRPYRRQSI